MRQRHKDDRQNEKPKFNDEKEEFENNRNIQTYYENNDIDKINNLEKRKTLTQIRQKPVLYKNFGFYKKLELNNLNILNINENNKTVSKENTISEINTDKKDKKIIKRKIISHEIGIKVNRLNKLRNKLYNKNKDIYLDTNQISQLNNSYDENIIKTTPKNSEDKDTYENNNLKEIDNNNNNLSEKENNKIKKIEVNLVKNRLKTIDNYNKTDKYSEKKIHYLNTESNVSERKKETININRKESNDLLSFVKKYKIKSIDKIKFKKLNIKINNNKYINENSTEDSFFKKYIATDSNSISRNKLKKSPFKLLVKNAVNNPNLSEVFNKMYNSYVKHKSNSKYKKDTKDLNNLTIDLQPNINDLSINGKNYHLNNIGKILREYGSESKNKKNSKLKKVQHQEEFYSNIKKRKPKIIEHINDKEMNNITSDNIRYSNNTRKSNDIHNKKTNYNSHKINIENIYSFLSKFKEILNIINNYESCNNEINDFILFFFNANIYESFINSFKIVNNKKKIINEMKIALLCFILFYYSSFYKSYNQEKVLFKTIFSSLNNIFLILVSYIINNFINIDNMNTIDKYILNDINLYIKKQQIEYLSFQEIHNENNIINLIEKKNVQIMNYYKMIVENLYNFNFTKNCYSRNTRSNIYFIFPKCLSLNIDKLNNSQRSKIISLFFLDSLNALNFYNTLDLKIFYDLYLKKEIIKNEINNNKKVINYQKYKNGYFRLINNNIKINKGTKNYLPPIKSNYKYSLMINLDSLIFDPSKFYKDSVQIIQIRPGIVEFLNEMKQIYELILFSNNNFEYILNILKYFESDENKLFENILTNYKLNFKVDGSIKNIELLDRKINHIIIIDKDKASKEINNRNTIYLKPYYGNANYDRNIMVNLEEILKNIRYDMEEIDDIRIGLENYKFIIFTKITNFLF